MVNIVIKLFVFQLIFFNLGEQKVAEAQAWVSEKGDEAVTKGAEILNATKEALATGTAVVADKVKQGAEAVAAVASNTKVSAEQVAEDAKTKANASTVAQG